MYKLTDIIANMIESALSWEQEHGVPRHDHNQYQTPEPLTIINIADTLNAPENAVKRNADEYQD